jgi:hypothetical protein
VNPFFFTFCYWQLLFESSEEELIATGNLSTGTGARGDLAVTTFGSRPVCDQTWVVSELR